MKRTTVGILILCVAYTQPMAANAQIQVGVRGGFASSTLHIEDLDDSNRRKGFTLGGFAAFGLGDVLGLDVGLAYTQKGVSGPDGGTDIEVRLDYLELPVLLTASLPLGGGASARLAAGPVIARDTGCETTLTQAQLAQTFDCDDPVFNGDLDRHSVDFGGSVSAGLSFSARGGVLLGLDAAYDFGLRTIDPDPGTSSKNRALTITGSVGVVVGG